MNKSLLLIAGLAASLLVGCGLPNPNAPSSADQLSYWNCQNQSVDDQVVCMDQYYYDRAASTGDLMYCGKLSMNANDCVYSVTTNRAISKNNVKLCDAIPHDQIQKKCQDSFYLVQAQKSDDKSLCQHISDASLQKVCSEETPATLTTPTPIEAANPLTTVLESKTPGLCALMGGEQESCLWIMKQDGVAIPAELIPACVASPESLKTRDITIITKDNQSKTLSYAEFCSQLL